MVIASNAIILKDKKILLIQRGKYTKAFPLHWACAGGRGGEGETPKEIVIRELKEELNLNFKPSRLFSTGQWEDRNLFRFLGEWSGEIKSLARNPAAAMSTLVDG
jgi:ADP-ribose pyrophosphatase YjhB (NUDIX family)